MGEKIPDRAQERTFLSRIGMDWQPDIEDVIDGLSSSFVEQQQSGGRSAQDVRGAGHGQQPVFDRSPVDRLDRHDYKAPPGAFQRRQQP
jgi:hypothetical protein